MGLFFFLFILYIFCGVTVPTRGLLSQKYPGNLLRQNSEKVHFSGARHAYIFENDNVERPSRIHSDDNGEVSWDPLLVTFEAWAKKSGVNFDHLMHAEFPGPVRGLMAKHDIESWENLVEMPETAMLQVDLTQKTCPVMEDLISPRYWDEAPWYVRLALVLLVEKSKGERSSFSSYIAILPAPIQMDTISHWSQLELTMLGYPQLARAKHIQAQLFKRLFVKLQQNANHPLFSQLDYETFEWALEIVLSRAYMLPPKTAPDSETVVSVLDSTGRQQIIPPEKNSQIFALLPMMDSLNHYSRFETDMHWSDENKLCIKTAQRYDKGDHVFVSYGPRSNDHLMQFYGFCEHENRNDQHVIIHPRIINRFFEANQPIETEAMKMPRLLCIEQDGIKDSSMAHLRFWVSTPEEKTVAQGNFATSISLDNEVKAWRTAISAIEAEIRAMDTSTQRISSSSIAEMTVDRAYMAEIFRAGKLRLLKQNLAKLKHFVAVSMKIGKVTTVWVAPEQDALKTVFYDRPV